MHLQSMKIQKKIEPETEKRVSSEIEDNISSNKIIDQIIKIYKKNKIRIKFKIVE